MIWTPPVGDERCGAASCAAALAWLVPLHGLRYAGRGLGVSLGVIDEGLGGGLGGCAGYGGLIVGGVERVLVGEPVMRVVRVGIVWGTGVSFSSIMHFYSFKTLLLSILIPFVGFSYALCPFLPILLSLGDLS